MTEIYTVFSFQVCASEPKDAMEDVSFVSIDGTYRNYTDASTYALNRASSLNLNTSDKITPIVGEDGGDVEYIFIGDGFSADNQYSLSEFHGTVIGIKKTAFSDSTEVKY